MHDFLADCMVGCHRHNLSAYIRKLSVAVWSAPWEVFIFILYIKGRLNAPLSNPSFHPCMHTWMHLRMNHLDAIAWTHSSCIPIIYHTSWCITCLFIMWKCTYVVGSMWQLSLAVSCYMCREQEWWILPMWSLPAAGRWRFGRLFKIVVVVVRNIYNVIQNINLHFLRVRNKHDQTN